MIKVEHTVFALPFAYIAAFVAAEGFPTAGQLFWITMAMVGARTAAMSLNRLIDRHIDALNPRTSGRALPKGLLTVKEVLIYTFLSFGLLYLAASMLNPLCVKLMPIAVAVLTIYPYVKRWSWSCHLVLGMADALAPLGAWVALTGSIDLPGVLLGLAMGFWVIGFDLIYACQDYDFDRHHGIHSIPARFGLSAALGSAKIFHLVSVIVLAVVGVSTGLGLFYWLGLVLATALLVYEHSLVKPTDLSKINIAFFNVNGYLSVSLLAFTILDIVL